MSSREADAAAANPAKPLCLGEAAVASGFDPVIEALKKDVDRTLLIENLRLTTDQRSQKFLRNMRLAYELLASRKTSEKSREH